MSVFNEMLELGGDAIDAIEGAANDFRRSLEDGVDDLRAKLEDLPDKAFEAVEDLANTIAEAAEKMADAAAAAIEAALAELGGLGQVIVEASEWLGEAVIAAASGIVDALGDLVDWVVDEAVPFAYAILKLTVIAVGILYTLPFWLLAIFLCTQVARVYGEEYGTVLQAIAYGYPRYAAIYRIRRIPAGGKYVIFSDLHRYSGGDLDIPSQQNVLRLYEGVLTYYWAKGYTVIENGDVEDYWLRGGSGWGVAYDIGAMLLGPSGDAAKEEALCGTAVLHLSRIVGNTANQRVYGILRLFHDAGRYFRTMGNHDDVYRSARIVTGLGRYFPGIEVNDFLVIESGTRPVALIAHGHQTDGWNQGACTFLGRVTTSVASAVNDVLPDGIELGVPRKDLWNYHVDDTLTEISPIIGVNKEQDSMNERVLRRTYDQTFGGHGPYIILGHTHAPKTDAWDPNRKAYWSTYLNDGAVLFPSTLTAVEWDLTLHPDPVLVAWRYGHASNELRRRRLHRDRDHELTSDPASEIVHIVP